MPDPTAFLDFGKLRNQVMHLAVPKQGLLSGDVLHFCCTTMERIVSDFWNESALLHSIYYDPETIDGGYVFEQLAHHKIVLSKATKARVKAARPHAVIARRRKTA